MARQHSTVQLMSVLTMAVLLSGCANPTRETTPTFGLRSMPPVSSIPADVQQMAVLYPRGETSDWSSAYGRLEGAAFQLKTFPPESKDHRSFPYAGDRLGAALSGRRACF